MSLILDLDDDGSILPQLHGLSRPGHLVFLTRN